MHPFPLPLGELWVYIFSHTFFLKIPLLHPCNHPQSDPAFHPTSLFPIRVCEKLLRSFPTLRRRPGTTDADKVKANRVVNKVLQPTNAHQMFLISAITITPTNNCLFWLSARSWRTELGGDGGLWWRWWWWREAGRVELGKGGFNQKMRAHHWHRHTSRYTCVLGLGECADVCARTQTHTRQTYTTHTHAHNTKARKVRGKETRVGITTSCVCCYNKNNKRTRMQDRWRRSEMEPARACFPMRGRPSARGCCCCCCCVQVA